MLSLKNNLQIESWRKILVNKHALAYIYAIEHDASPTILTSVQKASINIFCNDLDTINRLYPNFINYDDISLSRLKAVFPLIGGNSAAHKYNLITPLNTDAAFRLTYHGAVAPTHSALGIYTNGLSGYVNTHFNPSISSVQFKTSMGFYSGTNVSSTSSCMGNYVGVGGMTLLPNNAGTASTTQYVGVGSTASGIVTDSLGFYLTSRIANNNLKLYKNGITLGSQLTIINTALSSYTICIGAAPNIGNFWAGYCQFSFIGADLSDPEATMFSLAVNRLQKNLGNGRIFFLTDDDVWLSDNDGSVLTDEDGITLMI